MSLEQVFHRSQSIASIAVVGCLIYGLLHAELGGA